MKLSVLIYGAILRFYPKALRDAFGEEIMDAFTEDLLDAWRARGAFGVAAVWCCAAREIVTVAIPERLRNPALSARAVSVALHIAVIGGALAVASVQEAMPHHIWHGVVELDLHASRGR